MHVVNWYSAEDNVSPVNGELLCNQTTYIYLGVVINSFLHLDYAVIQRLSKLFCYVYINRLYNAFIQS